MTETQQLHNFQVPSSGDKFYSARIVERRDISGTFHRPLKTASERREDHLINRGLNI